MPLRKFKDSEGSLVLEIPVEHFKCPACNAGYQAYSEYGGLYSEDERNELSEDLFYADEYIICDAKDEDGRQCLWSGSARTIYNRAVKIENLVKCPCCKGTGMVKKGSMKGA